MKKLSIVIPVYYNEETLQMLYDDLCENLFAVINYACELIFVDDGSGDGSWEILKTLASKDDRVKIFRLSRNFGSHAAILCGLAHASGNCAVVKAADLQEPTAIIPEMLASWERGNNVVLAVREARQDSAGQTLFANLYYEMVRKTALPQMPKGGFDVYLVDRKVIDVLKALDENNSALTGQILWSGFKTDTVYYTRLERTAGKSRWTLKKKFRLVTDTLFSFTSLPSGFVTGFGALSCAGSLIWALAVLINRLRGAIEVSGWTTLFIFSLFSFGIIMVSLGILGSYLWRTFEATRNRPPYIVEQRGDEEDRERRE